MMKIRILKVNLLIYLLLLLMISNILFIVISCRNGNITEPYKYPIRPGMEEWKNLSGHERMVEVCQIPSDILKRLSTAGLVETILNYPLIGDIWAYNYPQEGIDAVTNQFNGLQELFSRQDSGAELLVKYSSLDILTASKNLFEQELLDYCNKVDVIEMLIAQQPVLSKLDAVQNRGLVKEALGKVTQKQEIVILSSGIKTSAWLLGCALRQSGYEPFMKVLDEDSELQNFLTTGFIYKRYDEITKIATQFIAEK